MLSARLSSRVNASSAIFLSHLLWYFSNLSLYSSPLFSTISHFFSIPSLYYLVAFCISTELIFTSSPLSLSIYHTISFFFPPLSLQCVRKISRRALLRCARDNFCACGERNGFARRRLRFSSFMSIFRTISLSLPSSFYFSYTIFLPFFLSVSFSSLHLSHTISIPFYLSSPLYHNSLLCPRFIFSSMRTYLWAISLYPSNIQRNIWYPSTLSPRKTLRQDVILLCRNKMCLTIFKRTRRITMFSSHFC